MNLKTLKNSKYKLNLLNYFNIFKSFNINKNIFYY